MNEECITLDQLHDELSRGRRLPLEGTLELTWRCNLRCPHCYLGEHRNTDEATLPQWERLADQMAEAGVLRLVITGGEPLLRKDFRDIYLLLKRRGFALVLFTNGTLLTEADADFLAEYPPAHIEITMYGASDATYSLAANAPTGSFERARSAAKMLRARNLPLNLKMTITSLLYKERDAIVAFADEIGAGFRASVELFKALDLDDAPAKLRLDSQERNNYLRRTLNLEEILRANAKRTPQNASDENLFNCRAGMSCFSVDPELKMNLCLLYRRWNYGLKQGTFAEGWQKMFAELRTARKTRLDRCVQCNLRTICNVCPALNYLETGDPEEPSPYLCENAHALGREFAQQLALKG